MKKIAKYLSLLIIVISLFTVFATQTFATDTEEQSVTIDKVGTIYYTVENNEITITGYKRMIPYANVTIEIPSEYDGMKITKIGDKAFYSTYHYVGKVVLPDTITYVGDYAFYDTDIEVNVPAYLEYAGQRSFGYTKLTTTVLPSTLTTIGACAFADCDSIVDVNFSSSLKKVGDDAFSDCDGITEIVFPNGIEYIGAFDNCSNLTSLTIPNMKNGTINGSFGNCTALKYVTIGNLENTVVGRYTFSGCTALESFHFANVEDSELCEYFFKGCTSLKTVTFTEIDNCTLGENFFADCTALESVNFGDAVNLTIPANMFKNCTALKSVIFGDVNGLTISDNAFKGCTSLSNFDSAGPENITIGAYAFSECSSLTWFDFESVNSVGEYAFSKSGITSVEIPQSVTLSAYAFANCPNLLTAVLNGAVSESVFENSTALKEATLTLPLDIPKRAFYGCTALEKVIAPKSTTVESYAFYNCKALKTFEYKQITGIEAYAFYGCSSIDNIDLSKFRGAFYEIPAYAFKGCTSLKNIGNCSPWEIGDYAFYACFSLESFDFSETDLIGEYAFAYSGLTDIDLSYQYCGVGRCAFKACNNIKELYFKTDVLLGEEAFAECEGLESIIIGDDVEFIGAISSSNGGYYFADCNNVKYFYIGKSFKDTHEEIAYCIFDFDLFTLGGLEAFEVSPENPYFFTDDAGVLYMNTTYENVDLVVLVCYPAGKTDTFYSTENALKETDRAFTIGEYAFCENKNLKELVLTKTVIVYINDEGDTIGFALRSAFLEAVIEKITFTGDNHFEAIGYMMFEDSNIKEINLDGVIEIGTYAFNNCQNLESVSSDTCLYIYEMAFENCKNLKSAKFPNCLEIYSRAFEDCYSLAEIDFEKLEYIDNHVFQNCKSLPATIELENVKDVGNYAFEGCTNITTVNLPKCTSLGCEVFRDTNITEIVLGNVYLYKYAFLDCTTLVSVKAKGLTASEKAFYGCTNLVSVEVENTASIGNSVFSGCTNLESFKSGSVTRIGDYAFSGCTKLKEFNCESVKSIGKYAFSGCASFETLNLTSVESIGDYAFNNCTNLKLVQLAQEKCTFGTGCFANCPDVSFFCEENTDPYNYAIANNIPVCAVTINLQKEAYEYTGSEIEPSVIVSISGMTLVQNKDYTLSFEDNIGRGNARLIVKFIGDFEGLPDAVRLFTITKADITASQVEYVVDNEYSGEEVKPKVVVKYGDKTLVEGTDYTIKYNSGTDAGSMFFTINGIGNYTGSIDCYYNIIRRDIAEATVSKDNDMTYTGEELTPKPTITWNGFTLVEGVDYEIRYFENVNSGYGTMVIYGMGNFCGTQRVQFKIFGKGIENAVVSEISDQTYTGDEITPDVTVTLDGVALTKDVDYTVKYENNTEKGMATVVISGIGNYSGVVKTSFNINKISVYSFTVFSETEMTETYDGTELKPEMEVYYGTTLLTEGVDYTVALENNINAGTATVTIIGIGLYEGERSYNFTILPCEITENDISVSGNMEYNGAAVEPEILITKNGATLVENQDYTVTYSNNEAVGTAVVTIEGMGNYQNTITLEYEIYPAESPDGWTLEDGKWAYYQNGEKLKNRWIQDSVNWCYLGDDGYCVANKWVKDSVTWCYVGADCRIVTNCWQKDSIGWCYLGSDGRMVTNCWVKDSVGWCYVDNSGHCVTNGWAKDSVGWCYLGADGRMVYSQWVEYENKWYYIDSNGYMVTGTKVIDGKTYKFDSNGVWLG